MKPTYTLLVFLSAFLLSVFAAFSNIRAEGLSPAVPVQNDFDGDGLSDTTRVSAATISGDAVWVWSAVSSVDDLSLPTPTPTPTPSPAESPSTTPTLFSKNMGMQSDIPILAHWFGADVAPVPAVVRLNGSNLTWKVLGEQNLIYSFTLGKAGNYIISGADFDGDGITDAAAVRTSGNKLNWTVMLNPLELQGRKSSTKRFSLRIGIGDQRIFFARVADGHDWAGVFGIYAKGRSRAQFYNVVTRARKTFAKLPIRLARYGRPRPIPMHTASGVDNLLFVTNDGADTTLSVYSLKGENINSTTRLGLGAVTIGNFLSDTDNPGEEYMYQARSSRVVYNPVTKALVDKVLLDYTPIDEITVQYVAAVATPTPTPSATPTPTPTPIPTPTPTPTLAP